MSVYFSPSNKYIAVFWATVEFGLEKVYKHLSFIQKSGSEIEYIFGKPKTLGDCPYIYSFSGHPIQISHESSYVFLPLWTLDDAKAIILNLADNEYAEYELFAPLNIYKICLNEERKSFELEVYKGIDLSRYPYADPKHEIFIADLKWKQIDNFSRIF